MRLFYYLHDTEEYEKRHEDGGEVGEAVDDDDEGAQQRREARQEALAELRYVRVNYVYVLWESAFNRDTSVTYSENQSV